MGAREKVQKLIDKKEQETAKLREEIGKNEIYVQALQEAIRLLPMGSGEPQQVTLRPGTDIDKARKAIQDAGEPLHISEIVKALGKPGDKKQKVALSGSIAAYVRKGQIFTKTNPNTFGLVEFNKPASSTELEVNKSFEEDGVLSQ